MLGQDPNANDCEITDPNMDGISSVAWSPTANFLAVGSWDNNVRCWEAAPGGSGWGASKNIKAQFKASQSAEAPVLTVAWGGDGSKIFYGGCDNKARCWDIGSNQVNVLGQHSAPIKSIFWVQPMNMLVTGSWDKTLRYWDGRSPNAVHTEQLPERLYCMDVVYPLCVLGTAERRVLIYDLRKPQAPFKNIESPLKYQSRTVACFPNQTGFALGSIEGRVAIHHVEDKDSSNNFAFKCHRDSSTNEIYAVNVISFHPTYGTFATAGSDGQFHYWDKDSKQRLKQFTKRPQPISAGSFNRDGSIFAYAVSYDWSKGAEYYNPSQCRNYVYLHANDDSEIKNRPKGRKK